LLGSQRDYFWLQNRVDNGAISDLDFEFLGGFTDLVQYAGITTADFEKRALCERVIAGLTGQNWQSKLTEIGMFSVTGKKIYTDTGYLKFEAELNKPIIVPSVFMSASKIYELKNTAMGYLLGQTHAKESLKVFLEL